MAPEPRIPPTLLGGRVRTSTVIIGLLFLAVLALYLVVRPPPESGPSSRAAIEARERDKERRQDEATPTPTAPPAASASPSPGDTPTPQPSPDRQSGGDAGQQSTATPQPTAEPEDEATPAPTEAEGESTPSP